MAVTKNINPEIARLIRLWRESTNRTRLGLAGELGVGKTTLSNWELGQNEPNPVILVALAGLAEGDYERQFLLLAKEKAGLTRNDITAIAGVEDLPSEMPTGAKDRRTKQRRRSSFVEIPLVAGLAGAGAAYVHEQEESEGKLSVPKDICPNPLETRCIRVRGESMEPTIVNGTIAAVDHSQRRVEKLVGKIVAAWNETEGVVLKRLRRADGKLRLASDNTAYDPRDLDDGWEIVGRVIWWIQTS